MGVSVVVRVSVARTPAVNGVRELKRKFVDLLHYRHIYYQGPLAT
jgi:hypothetical protein